MQTQAYSIFSEDEQRQLHDFLNTLISSAHSPPPQQMLHARPSPFPNNYRYPTLAPLTTASTFHAYPTRPPQTVYPPQLPTSVQFQNAKLEESAAKHVAYAQSPAVPLPSYSRPPHIQNAAFLPTSVKFQNEKLEEPGSSKTTVAPSVTVQYPAYSIRPPQIITSLALPASVPFQNGKLEEPLVSKDSQPTPMSKPSSVTTISPGRSECSPPTQSDPQPKGKAGGGRGRGKRKAQVSVEEGDPAQSVGKNGKLLLTEEEKRANHIESEKKRRLNIKVGFDQLVELVPSLTNCHRSEALILEKSVEHVRYLLRQREELKARLTELSKNLGEDWSIDEELPFV
ncbi:hypothetical protein BJ742DRAFT_850875 [Cladochytrium replicatum]|nr:hypothetical protein BJ742DRAFT_850875 [Cladochytrium replicatum]